MLSDDTDSCSACRRCPLHLTIRRSEELLLSKVTEVTSGNGLDHYRNLDSKFHSRNADGVLLVIVERDPGMLPDDGRCWVTLNPGSEGHRISVELLASDTACRGGGNPRLI